MRTSWVALGVFLFLGMCAGLCGKVHAQELPKPWTVALPPPGGKVLTEDAQRLAEQAAVGMLKAERDARIAEAELRTAKAKLELAKVNSDRKVEEDRPKQLRKDAEAQRDAQYPRPRAFGCLRFGDCPNTYGYGSVVYGYSGYSTGYAYGNRPDGQNVVFGRPGGGERRESPQPTTGDGANRRTSGGRATGEVAVPRSDGQNRRY